MDAAHLPHVAGIVLAAGSSSRMGRPKLIMPFRGEPLISPVLRTACAHNEGGYPLLSPVVAVLSPRSAPELRGVLAQQQGLITVTAEDAEEGMSASLKAGLCEVLRRSDPVMPDGVCVLLGDQPLVDARTLYTLLDAFACQPDAFIVPAHQGQRGNPVIIPSCFFDEIQNVRGDMGARALLRRPDVVVRTVEVGNSSVLLDVDTPEAYRDLRSQHER